ncbi:hypothetical protein SDC9_209581 [bioreactor metagenome]|uniref:Uncharacterized protein n=1 Tax=bioreactor metagenome TaxID=1076179 RepID=A0A645JEQ2_9ZZZZ
MRLLLSLTGRCIESVCIAGKKLQNHRILFLTDGKHVLRLHTTADQTGTTDHLRMNGSGSKFAEKGSHRRNGYTGHGS